MNNKLYLTSGSVASESPVSSSECDGFTQLSNFESGTVGKAPQYKIVPNKILQHNTEQPPSSGNLVSSSHQDVMSLCQGVASSDQIMTSLSDKLNREQVIQSPSSLGVPKDKLQDILDLVKKLLTGII